MRRLFYCLVCAATLACVAACNGSKEREDRTEAQRMFSKIVSLTETYTHRISVAPDSVAWVKTSMQFEDSLEKINFSFSADTDLLLSEGQNDTISRLINAYVKARNERIRVLLHPIQSSDSIVIIDDIADASHSLGS